MTYPCHALPYAVCDTCSFVAMYRDVPLWEPESIAPITAASRTTFGPFTHVGDIDLATRVLSKKADVIKSARSAGYAALGLGHKSGDLDYTLRDHGDETADAIEMAVFGERGTPCAHGLRKNLCATPLHYQLDYLANYLVDEHLGLHGVVHAMTTPLPYPYWVTGSTGAALLKVATGDGWFLAFTTTSRKNPLIYPDDSPGFTCSHEWFVTVCTEGVVNRVLLGTAPISARPLTFEEVRDRALIPWRAVNTSGIKDTCAANYARMFNNAIAPSAETADKEQVCDEPVCDEPVCDEPDANGDVVIEDDPTIDDAVALDFALDFTYSHEELASWGHRSGWSAVMYHVSRLSRESSTDRLLLIDIMEKTFSWDAASATITRPFVGVWHNPPNMPDWFDYEHSPNAILGRDARDVILRHCKGVIVFSDYLRDWLRAQLPDTIPIITMYHPTDTDVERFDPVRYAANTDRCVMQIGYWLRRMSFIAELRTTTRSCGCTATTGRLTACSASC